jgi:hypothetical protein
MESNMGENNPDPAGTAEGHAPAQGRVRCTRRTTALPRKEAASKGWDERRVGPREAVLSNGFAQG